MSPKAKLWLIFLVCAAPIALGTAAWYFGWGTPGTANYGELIAPRPLEGPAFQALRGKWVLVTFDPAACPEACEKKLYIVRQARRAQGANAERVERLWLLTDGATPKPALVAALQGGEIRPLAQAGDPGAFPGETRDHIYLVDPLGNLMMRFPRDPDPKRLIEDLERLLKLSRIG